MNTLTNRISKTLKIAILAFATCAVAIFFAGCACSNNAANDYASEDDAGYIGTWTGKLESTTTGPACYAAQNNPIEITVKSVETTGRMVLDIKVLCHGHTQDDLDGDADSFQGDKVITLTDQTATLDGESFSVTSEQDDVKLTIDGTWTGIGDSLALDVTVSSRIGYSFPIEDTFTLTKK